jgi:alkylation response protein AidB-like acyl-CoA dehydrogenase
MSIATASVGVAKAPAYEDLIARAHTLVPHIADRAAQCEANCRVPDETVARFRETGLHKTLLPAAYGGYEMGFSAVLETSFAIGKVCASSAWVCGLYMVHSWLGALFPKQAQEEMWGQDPDAFISGSYAPIGKASLAEGGYRLSGRFPFCSGSPGGRMESLRRDAADRARWQAGASLPVGAEGRLQDRLGKLASRWPCRNRKL